MNKKIVTILLVAFLFIGGTFNLLAEEETITGDMTDDYKLTESQQTGSPIPCGEGNGPGNPG